MTHERDALITGIGIVSSLGCGVDAHWQALSNFRPVLDTESFPPFAVHPLAPLDLDKQIPKRGDQRQMEAWQRIGVFAAGLALDSAGVKGNTDLLANMGMIVAAGGGERDYAVDAAILSGYPKAADPGVYLNERLLGDLRPTLFLAQLSNLLAGNISIVHGVIGSSRTFMGEEASGADSVRTACARIAAGQGDIMLVGGSYNAQRADVLLHYEMGGVQRHAPFDPVWARQASGGGMILGSVGCFLVIESRQHAASRGAAAYAHIAAIRTDRCGREPGEAAGNARAQLQAMAGHLDTARAAVISGASGARAPTVEEAEFLAEVGLPVRAAATALGHSIEPSFPASLALAAMAVQRPRVVPAAGTGRTADDGAIGTGAGDLMGSLAGRIARTGHGRPEEIAMTKDTDHLGRPVVVITGMGVLTSLGQGQADNWKALTQGVSGIRRITRFPVEGLRTTIAGTVDFVSVRSHSAPALSQALAERVIEEAVAEAGIGQLGDFPGPLFLALPPVEIEWTQRLALAAASGAKDTVTYDDLIRAAGKGGSEPVYRRFLFGSVGEALAVRFGTKGSPVATSTACASGGTAIQLGVEAIRRGETEAALVVGTDSSVNPESLVRFSLLSALSTRNDPPSSASRPFSKDREGFVMAEGAGALVLESLASARARGARCWVGRGMRRGGGRVPPDAILPGRQADHRLHAERAWRMPGWQPDAIDYINAHGTGTPENDKMEWFGVSAVFGERAGFIPIVIEQVDDWP